MDRKRAIQILEDQLSWLKDNESEEIDPHELPWPWWLVWPPQDLENQLAGIRHQLVRLAERGPCRCAMSSPAGRNVLQLMTHMGPAELERGIEYIRRGLEGVRRLVICDPYLLKSRRDASAKDMIRKLSEVIPASTKTLEIFVKPRARDRDVAAELNQLCRERGIRLVCRRTHKFHDRVWIGDDEVAYSVGASFNGLGQKPAFILPLPREDAHAFILAIRDARDTLPKSKSA